MDIHWRSVLDVWSFSFTVVVFFPVFYIVIDLLFVVLVLVSNFLLAVIFCFCSYFEEKVFETVCYITQAGLKLAMQPRMTLTV